MARRSKQDEPDLFGTTEDIKVEPVVRVKTKARPRQPLPEVDDKYLAVLKQRISELPDDRLATERDLIDVLNPGAHTLRELYAYAVALGIADTDEFNPYDNQEEYKHRLRNALQSKKAQGGMANPSVGTWVVLDGTREAPRRAMLILMGAPSDIMLMVAEASQALREIDEPVDLIICDPPYGMGVNQGELHDRGDGWDYARRNGGVVRNYFEVPKGMPYEEFSERWIGPAAQVLRPGGFLAVITGPQQAADVQKAAEYSGLTYVNSLWVDKRFAVRSQKRFAHSHWRVTLMCNGRHDAGLSTFNVPDDLPLSNYGETYPRDGWDNIPKYERVTKPGEPDRLKYPNALHPLLPDRLIRALTNVGDLVVDPMFGSGQVPYACLVRNRRCIGFDQNPDALPFAMGRIYDIVTRQRAAIESGRLSTWGPFGAPEAGRSRPTQKFLFDGAVLL